MGTFSFGGESVTFTRSLGEITVDITGPTGAQTQITLPTTSDTTSGTLSTGSTGSTGAGPG